MAQRPRDRLGRPLRSGPAAPDVPEPASSGAETLASAAALLADGLPFLAHEVFEQRWRDGPVDEREVWRGLAQWAAGLTHSARGNRIGADRLGERARLTIDAVEPWPSGFPLDRHRLAQWLELHERSIPNDSA